MKNNGYPPRLNPEGLSLLEWMRAAAADTDGPSIPNSARSSDFDPRYVRAWRSGECPCDYRAAGVSVRAVRS